MASRNRIRAMQLVLQQCMATDAPISDTSLLERFIANRDEVAFELLVQRHQRLVYGVCHRVLNDSHDAEDAFQATFLALARKASSIVNREAVSTWLYKVAYRVALTVRSARPIRRSTLGTTEDRSVDSDVAASLEAREIGSIIDEELHRLPEPFRTTAILCHLEGKSIDEVALLLGCPRGTVASRLTRARDRLRLRLTRRGVGLGAMSLSVSLFPAFTSANVPSAWVAAIVRTVCPISTGQTVATATLPNKVLTLTEEVLRAMFFKKLTQLMAFLVTITATVLIGGTLALRAGPNPGESPQAAPKMTAEDKAKAEKANSELLKDRREVTVCQPVSKELPRYIDFAARLEALEPIQILADQFGIVTKIAFKKGDEVKKGDLLFEISRDVNTKGVDSVEVTRIVAPAAGKLTEPMRQEQQLIRGNTLLVKLVPKNKIGIRFEMDEVSFLRYRKLQREKEVRGVGEEIQVNLAAEKAGFSRKGTLDRFEDAFDPKSGTLAVHALMSNEDDLLPGMFVTVRIAFGKPRSVVLVPKSSLSQDETVIPPNDERKKYVLVVNDDGIIERRVVRIGEEIDEQYDITEGLRGKEWVIKKAWEDVKPGDKVKVNRAVQPKK